MLDLAGDGFLAGDAAGLFPCPALLVDLAAVAILPVFFFGELTASPEEGSMVLAFLVGGRIPSSSCSSSDSNSNTISAFS